MTDLGLFDVTPNGFVMREIAPGLAPADVVSVTEAELTFDDNLSEISGVLCAVSASRTPRAV